MICEVAVRLAAFSFGLNRQDVIGNIDVGAQIAENTSKTAKKIDILAI